MKTVRFTVAVFFIIIAYSVSLVYLAYNVGYKTAKAEVQAQTNMDKKTLDNHAKEIQNIRSESDSSANARLRKNLLTN